MVQKKCQEAADCVHVMYAVPRPSVACSTSSSCISCVRSSVHGGVSILMHAECGGATYRAVNVIVVDGGVWCHWASGAREPVPGRLHTYAQLFLEL